MKQGWEIKKLGNICETSSGGTPSKSHSEYYENGNIPWLRSGEISQGYIYETELYITEEGLKKSSAKIFPTDTVVIAMYGATVGQVGILKREMSTNQAVCGIFPTPMLYPLFLVYYLKAKKAYFLSLAAGGAQPNISQNIIKNTPIPVPPIAEQEKIVAELDCLSGIIEKKKQQLKELDSLAQSIFYEMFGNPIDNEKGWEVKKLGEVVVSNMVGLTRSGKEQDLSYPYLYFKMNNIGNHGEVDWTKYTRVCASPKELEKYSLRKGDFLFNTRNSYELVGKTCIYNIEKDDVCVFNNNVMRIEFNDCINVYYIAHLFQNQYIKEQLDKIKKGTTNVWAIYFKDLAQIKILTPLYLLQQEFASKIEAIEKQKTLIKQSIAETEMLFNSRMEFYFS